MLPDLPVWIPTLFVLTVIVSVVWFYSSRRSHTALVLLLVWTGLQSCLALSGIIRDTEAMPPRLMLFGFLPALLCIILMLTTSWGKRFIEGLDVRQLTYFHSVRIPVEIVLAALYHQGAMSVLITFEGTNFDILSGITAPLVGYFAFKNRVHKKLLFWWNILCLLLLLNVVITAIFSIPSPIQKLAFDQPNVAVLYFPFYLLPTVVVPLVLFAHLVVLKRLMSGKL